jgi:hypothetical protein
MSDYFVSMKKISKREMTRHPSQLTAIRPGESIQVEDREGGLVVMRKKKHHLTAEEISTELARLAGDAPEMDTLALLQEGE